MAAIQWFFGLSVAVVLVAFIAFVIRQGTKVRPLPPDERPPVNRTIVPRDDLQAMKVSLDGVQDRHREMANDRQTAA
jgi:hypothetical protein